MSESVPVHIITKTGALAYRNFLDMSDEEKDNIEKITFGYSRDEEKYGAGLNCVKHSEVVPQWLDDVYTGKSRNKHITAP